jgi:hypothetical protein
MTPKEKAFELVDKMLIGFIDWTYHIPTEINDNHTILSEAKQRALIAVNEIIKQENVIVPQLIKIIKTLMEKRKLNESFKDDVNIYWKEVKQEIENI